MSLEIRPWKVNFHVFLSPILMIWNICFGDRVLPRRTFYRSQFIKYSVPFCPSWLPLFVKIWMIVESGCFTVTLFNLHSSWESKSLKLFLLLSILKLVIFSTAFFIVRWSLQSSFDISKLVILSLNNLMSVFSAVVRSFSLSMFQHML